MGLEEGAQAAGRQRFRPVLMTTLVAMLGLLPAALSNGIGSQTQKPLAIVVIGGSLVLAILIRALPPAAARDPAPSARAAAPPGGPDGCPLASGEPLHPHSLHTENARFPRENSDFSTGRQR